MNRKFIRDKIRRDVGNKNLRTAWENHQRKKYGNKYFEKCVAIQK